GEGPADAFELFQELLFFRSKPGDERRAEPRRPPGAGERVGSTPTNPRSTQNTGLTNSEASRIVESAHPDERWVVLLEFFAHRPHTSRHTATNPEGSAGSTKVGDHGLSMSD